MTLSTILNGLSAVSAIAAAWLWFQSARIRTPEKFSILVNSMFDESFGIGQSPELTALGNALVRQSKLSASAAVCAGVSALAQACVWILAAATTIATSG